MSYFLPGWDLAHGLGFSPDYRRAPLYSWSIAASLIAFGDQLSSISLVQHLLSAAVAAMTVALGWLTFRRGVGIVGGLIVAVSGPLLIYGQRIDAETLFGFLIVVTALVWVIGIRGGRHRWFLAGGLALGLAALTRPAGQIVILALPLALLMHSRSLRGAVIPSATAALGLLLVKAPWTLLLFGQTGLVTGGATLGEPLLSHLVFGQQWMTSAYRGEQLASEFRLDAPLYNALTASQIRFRLPDERLNPYGDDLLNQARRQSIRLLAQGQSPSATRERIERSVRITPAEIDSVFQDLAFEMTKADPWQLVASSLRGSALVMLGRVEHLQISWDARRNQAGPLMEDNWYEVRRIRDLVQPATLRQMAAYPAIDALTNFLQPARYGGIITLFMLLGALPCLYRRRRGAGALLLLMVLLLMLVSTTFSWAAPRYRYPVDPLIYLLATAGALMMLGWLVRAVRKANSLARGCSRSAAATPTLETVNEPGASR